MPFPEIEKQAMLQLKGVGPTVIRRLEEAGYQTLAELAAEEAIALCRRIGQMLHSSCWGNSPQAHASLAAIIALAQQQTADAAGGQRVRQLLDDWQQHQPEQAAIVLALRRQILALDPAISEEVKYGGILFACSQAFCGLFVYRQHVTLEFSAGAQLADVHGLLQGKGKGRRHLKFVSVADIDRLPCADYLQQALTLARPAS